MRYNFFYIILILSIFGCDKYEDLESKNIYQSQLGFVNDSGENQRMKFLYSVPDYYDKSKKYPVIIALHGYGSNMNAFHDIFLSTCQKKDYVLVTPQGEISVENGFGFGWSNNSPAIIVNVLNFISKQIHIDKKNVKVVGFSDGGKVAYQIVTKYFDKFSGLAALCAPFYPDLIPSNFVMLKDFKAYISYGELETNISKQSLLAAETLKKANFQTQLVKYNGIGHSLPEPMSLEIEKILLYLEK